MINLGKIERINDLRTVWPHEANDFSKWLAQEENLTLLSEAVGISIIKEELESAVGGFSVDIFATEEGSGRKIIIENQLEDTNHDHLGKIITYASGKEAQVIIWIVKRARDEHRNAIEWLNQHTDQNIGFFLLEIELWKINNSIPAPRFNVVERPNDWAKTIKSVDALSDTKKLQYEFWQAFCDYANNHIKFTTTFSLRKPQPQHWYDLSAGSSSCHIGLTVNTQKKVIGTEIYITDDKDTYEKFFSHKNEIEAELNMSLEWITATKDCRILAVHNGDIKTGTATWINFFSWYCDMAIALRKIISKYS